MFIFYEKSGAIKPPILKEQLLRIVVYKVNLPGYLHIQELVELSPDRSRVVVAQLIKRTSHEIPSTPCQRLANPVTKPRVRAVT